MGHIILIGNEVHAHEVIDSLVGLHLRHLVRIDDRVSPAYVPFFSILACTAPV